MQNALELNKQISWIKLFAGKSNITASDWKEYNTLSKKLEEALCKEDLTVKEKKQLKEAYGSIMTPQTLQGFVLAKPRGYASDYKIIDNICTLYTSPDERLAKLDNYQHTFPAALSTPRVMLKTCCEKKCQQATGLKFLKC